jgi:6-phosphofructokinase 1
VVLVSEGATITGQDEMVFSHQEADQYGHKKLGGIGDRVSAAIEELSPKYNGGRRINTTSQRLGYLVRSGDPDALDSIVPMAFGNLALDLIEEGKSGLLVAVRKGVYDTVPIDAVIGATKNVDVERFYNTDRLRPNYRTFANKPLFIMTSE